MIINQQKSQIKTRKSHGLNFTWSHFGAVFQKPSFPFLPLILCGDLDTWYLFPPKREHSATTSSSDTHRVSTKASLVETRAFLERTEQRILEAHFGEAPGTGVCSVLTLMPKCMRDWARLQRKGLAENCRTLKDEKTHRKSTMSAVSKVIKILGRFALYLLRG